MGIKAACKLRPEVLKGDLDDAIFAADFGDVVLGNAPPVYGKAKIFFQNTHPARQLRKVAQMVFRHRLSDPREGGAHVRLSTGFGGGKTHTLMALWHLAKNIADLSLGTEILPAAGRPRRCTWWQWMPRRAAYRFSTSTRGSRPTACGVRWSCNSGARRRTKPWEKRTGQKVPLRAARSSRPSQKAQC